MKNTLIKFLASTFFVVLIQLLPTQTFAQAEFETWGNLTGIRVDDQLMEFNSTLLIENKWGDIRKIRKEGQEIDFERTGDQKTFRYKLNDINWTQNIISSGEGKAVVTVTFSSEIDTILNGAYFRINLPKEYARETTFSAENPAEIHLEELSQASGELGYKAPVTSIRIESPTKQLKIETNEPTEVSLESPQESDAAVQLKFLIADGEISTGETFRKKFSITATGEIDNSPLKLEVFPAQEGDPFDGIGGNFRLQNPDTDPQVIDYALENLRVAWGRVEMPWRKWQPEIDGDPVAEAKKGNLHPEVEAAMQMAQRLDQMGIPVILATWFAPNWAIIGGKPFKGQRADGTMGNLLDLSKKEEIYESLTSYIKYMKEEYGVETALFSFNESDLGIDVRQTAEEHNQLIKELGAYFRSQGIQTEFLLGDTSDANAWEFTTIASLDPEAQPYIGGVSFHSWRGWTDENLIKWADISNRVGEPLFIGEGSIDASAWRFPEIFEEPTYALEEIDVYINILNKAHPLSILQWQLTADYSPMSGGGIFGNTEEQLHPTQRFFNLKQLGSTPKGLYAIPVTKNKVEVTVAALGDMEKEAYAIHLVNNAASRPAILTGLPQGVTELELFLTDENTSFEKIETIEVKNGTAEFQLPGAGFISLMTPR